MEARSQSRHRQAYLWHQAIDHSSSSTPGLRINVGKYCSVAPGVVFVVGRHLIENVSSFPFKAYFLKGGKPDDERDLPSSLR